MCGRYSLTTPEEAMRQLFDLPAAMLGAWTQPRYNIAPSQIAPVVRRAATGSGPELVGMTWGLIPRWSGDRTGGQINARSETAAEKPSFRDAYRHRRCLVPTDGFYEWQRIAGSKQPYWISRTDGAPFVFAGLWESWSDGQSAEIVSFTILTTEASEALRSIHHRMPVILGTVDFDAWLDPGQSPSPELFAPEQAPRLQARPVSRRVNSPRNDDSACLKTARIEPAQGNIF
ncbi:MAG: SOS response-associated peptidase [Alphaproteobacteria bacterium]|jgi:putative SOS response-associated peptidase YedK|nr:hypothetical protein [Rhodospirillaceae bacterium]MDP6023299.1 SOS response-associated peptidase [Alphaproteobacteria bacterium]MDP6255700.1 SOS response-associated peptidase [Alphaproteobacteria bacterium]MDP7052961.1 SOS response-associated peptidase [Alphaproteobacteria bacterium]MDP7228767.1 SOS response-associated peptidase [Alphaproteobacteria bacterium]|tara:strand:+ start:1987 stop:2679 length:693 start_codon:yes stop_codon:yes gene_type:complete